MPNSVGPNGITIQTPAEIRLELLNGAPTYPGMLAIYGANINVAPNSPDGQMLEIITQAKLDGLEQIQQVASSFDPDQAVGILLDQRAAINGVTRQAGTPTLINVNVTVDRALTLIGAIANPSTAFTVSDATGNNYQLINSYAFSAAGTQLLAFQATVLGALTPLANTLTIIVTITLGVTLVNNPAAATAVGTNEESDSSLRLRRAQSVSKPSISYLGSVIGALYSVASVTNVSILENITNSTDGNGIPGHSVWPIAKGTATTQGIATAIYLKRHAGTGQKGLITYPITQVDGSTFNVLFDRATAQIFWISFNTATIGPGPAPDNNFIRAQLLAQLVYNINQPADTTTIISIIHAVSPSTAVSSAGVSSDGTTYFSQVPTAGVQYYFQPDATRIIINGSAG